MVLPVGKKLPRCHECGQTWFERWDMPWPFRYSTSTTKPSARRRSFSAKSTLSWVCLFLVFLVSSISPGRSNTHSVNPHYNAMTFDFVHHVKARTRSVQLDKVALQSISQLAFRSQCHPQPGKRTSSLGTGLENTRPPSPASIQHIRRYRSMLEVEDPPIIQAVEPMTFDELYPRKLDESKPVDIKPELNEPDHGEQGDQTTQENEAHEETLQDQTCQRYSLTRIQPIIFAICFHVEVTSFLCAALTDWLI